MIKSHKQIPIDPQLVLAKKHAHHASARESSNQIQIKLQVHDSKFWFKQSSNFKTSYNNYIFKFQLQVQVVSFQKSIYYVHTKYVQ
jgi:hypothetical protein